MAKPKLPPCPMCGHSNNAVAQGDGQYWCKKHGLYDNDPHEGSDVFSDPSRRMELQEARQQRGRRR